MSQADFNIDNISRSLFRAENNTSLQALASLSSGATEPATTYAYQLWADTTTGLLKQRNAANSAWVDVLTMATGIPSSVVDASETVKGIVELATSAEVITGTDTVRAVTPAGLQSKVASQSALGIIELLTDAEYVTGTDTTRALTAAVARSKNLVSGTAVASTSGTSIDFTGIPSWAKRITVMFNGVSTNGSSNKQIQIGNLAIQTSGYSSTASFGGDANQFLYATSGFVLDNNSTASASISISGIIEIALFGLNIWVVGGNISAGAVGQVSLSIAGNHSGLSGSLDRIRITTVNGTDTFDAGSINIMYE